MLALVLLWGVSNWFYGAFAAANKALHDGKVVGTIIGNENRLRLAVSVFNTHDDIDRAIAVLGGRSSSSVR